MAPATVCDLSEGYRTSRPDPCQLHTGTAVAFTPYFARRTLDMATSLALAANRYRITNAIYHFLSFT